MEVMGPGHELARRCVILCHTSAGSIITAPLPTGCFFISEYANNIKWPRAIQAKSPLPMMTRKPPKMSGQTKPQIKMEFNISVRMKRDSTGATEEDETKIQRPSRNEAADASLSTSDTSIKETAEGDVKPHNAPLQINIHENIIMPDPKLQQKLLNNLTSLQDNKEERKQRPRLRTLAPKPPAETRSRSDFGASDSEEPFPDFDPNFPSIDERAEQSWSIPTSHISMNNVPQLNLRELPLAPAHSEVNCTHQNSNFLPPSMDQQPHPPANFAMNNFQTPNMSQAANPFSHNQIQGNYSNTQNVSIGQLQNQLQMQNQMDYQRMMQNIHQGYLNHPQQQGNYGQTVPSNHFADAQITQGPPPPVSTQHLGYVSPVDTSTAPRFHQKQGSGPKTPSALDNHSAADSWDAFIDEEEAKSNMRKRSLTSAHPEMGPNGYRNPAMGLGMGINSSMGEYVANEEAWSGAPRGAPKRTLVNCAPQFNPQRMYQRNMNMQQMMQQQMYSQQVNPQQMNLQQWNSQQMGFQPTITPQMILQQSQQQYGMSQMGPPSFTQMPGRNRSMSRTNSVTSPNLLGRKNSTSSRASRGSSAHSKSDSVGVSKRSSETGSSKRSSFSKPNLQPTPRKISVPNWASGGPNTRRASINGGTKANPIRVPNSPVGNSVSNAAAQQIMSPALTPIVSEVQSTFLQGLTLPSPEMPANDQSMDFLKDAEDQSFAIRDLGIQPTQEDQLSNLLQAQVHLGLLALPQTPVPSLESPLETTAEAQEETEVKQLMQRLIRTLQVGVDGLVSAAKVEEKAVSDDAAARGRMKQALGDLMGEMGKALGIGSQETWDPDMSDMNAILEGWTPENGNVDDLFGDGFENGNGNGNADDENVNMNLE